ncbi:chromate efflux transporter [Chitinimonas sp.]|uniref:chromate efflux transporter n=1 Tax=Chitinimonas sp. TaxID=1934313 RepID=UPI002F958966
MPPSLETDRSLNSPVAPISLAEAWRFWLKLGLISFGGPAGQIAIMHSELVERRRWLSERRFLHALNYCMLLPGPEAQQLATYIGWLMHRSWGGLIAGGLFVLPSLLLLIGLSWAYLQFGQLPWVAGVFHGIKPAVTAIVLHAGWRIGGRVLRRPMQWWLAGLAFVAIAAWQLPFPLIVLLAAAAGYLAERWRPGTFSVPPSATKPDAPHPKAWLDDDSPPPVHTRYRPRRTAVLLLLGALLWALPMALLCLREGWQGTLPQMGWFFSKAALLTFGGAYAVLPYVFQGAVGHYGWLSAGQMMDGLALGETTPGPLIMVVAFVGFVGGHAQPTLAGGSPFWAGALAACVVTWFTFLPSFLFILIGGPLVESGQRQLALAAPLAGIGAAVVGVILNLALFFGLHTVWPQGWRGEPDLVAMALCAATLLALFRFKVGVIPVILACALAGGLLQVLS